MRIRLKADITFDAENLDDACAKLEAHFKYLPMEGDEGGQELQFVGDMKLDYEMGES
jgi:hypothetical protein